MQRRAVPWPCAMSGARSSERIPLIMMDCALWKRTSSEASATTTPSMRSRTWFMIVAEKDGGVDEARRVAAPFDTAATISYRPVSVSSRKHAASSAARISNSLVSDVSTVSTMPRPISAPRWRADAQPLVVVGEHLHVADLLRLDEDADVLRLARRVHDALLHARPVLHAARAGAASDPACAASGDACVLKTSETSPMSTLSPWLSCAHCARASC